MEAWIWWHTWTPLRIHRLPSASPGAPGHRQLLCHRKGGKRQSRWDLGTLGGSWTSSTVVYQPERCPLRGPAPRKTQDSMGVLHDFPIPRGVLDQLLADCRKELIALGVSLSPGAYVDILEKMTLLET